MNTMISVKLPEDLLLEAKALAAAQERSLSWLIRDLLKKAVAAEKEKPNGQK